MEEIKKSCNNCVKKGHTRNWYRHIGNNLWINYNCTSEGY